MSGLIFILGLVGGIQLIAWWAVRRVTVVALHRAIASNAIETTAGNEVHPMRLDALGSNPGVHTRYVSFDVPAGEKVIVMGQAHPECQYLSVTLYDPLLQSVPAHSGRRTWLVDPPMDDHGRFRLILAHEDPGEPGWLDISDIPQGVLWERHVGPEPGGFTRLVAGGGNCFQPARCSNQ